MKKIISTSEIIGTYSRGNDEIEVCAAAEANFDEEKSRLVMKLDCFLRWPGPDAKARRASADWMPKENWVDESTSREDATPLARDIFHRWVGKVRQSTPYPLHT